MLSDLFFNVVGVPFDKLQTQQAAVISSLVVIIGWYIARLSQIKSDRVKNTMAFVDFLRSEEVANYRKAISKKVNTRGAFSLFDSETRQPLMRILEIIEYTCASISTGLISESYIYSVQKTLIHSLFISSSKMTHNMRVFRGSNTIYENIEAFYIRTVFYRHNFAIAIIDAIFGRPLYGLSLTLFRFEYKFLSKLYNLNDNYLLEDWNRIKKYYNEWNNFVRFVLFLLCVVFIFYGYR
ncbi:hypothetical protein M2323_001780 [Rhodoblastus acidophilus]|uniref:DUF4760 domain-containing protein n=1 Tax=Rhodoblastus acidophilus TaxID=1074 RepID=UPI002224F27F|nr:hypothetical protein [Rhodoblastus acidophilus]MCW2283788.1 hypothetical protein [Rhodoblastus acidophilus]MCW2332863.1 hypothetical protein [Rhodoblastus acidophilus]